MNLLEVVSPTDIFGNERQRTSRRDALPAWPSTLPRRPAPGTARSGVLGDGREPSATPSAQCGRHYIEDHQQLASNGKWWGSHTGGSRAVARPLARCGRGQQQDLLFGHATEKAMSFRWPRSRDGLGCWMS